MRHHQYNPDFKFVEEPISFNKYTDKDMLRYCLGATMYMPGSKDFAGKILSNAMPGLTSMVLDFEDACKAEDLSEAEDNALALLEEVGAAVEDGRLSDEHMPLVFCRVRSPKQFEAFASKIQGKHLRALCGINFPKFNGDNGDEYYGILRDLNERVGEIVYGMPIIEDSRVAYAETRIEQLLAIRSILDKYEDLVLHVRVGATDFSSCFGMRRGIDYTIYDIMTVRQILADILNIFGRNNDYVVSGPVWEYFRADKSMKFQELAHHDVQESILKRKPVYNNEVDGLLREMLLDRANGFVGKTVIHPTHVKFVNAMSAVTEEEYRDAMQILETSGGVKKSPSGNKMNEIAPHRAWASRIAMRAKVYGVIKDGTEYFKLFSGESNA